MPSGDELETVAARRLALWLRVIGLIDLVAVVAVLLPTETLARIHAALELGAWPDLPIVIYLARSASWMYALCGVLFLFVSGDVVRYRALIRFLAACGVVTGLVLMGVDLTAGMPIWWTATEGPCCLGLAVVTWCLTSTLGQSGSASSARKTG